MPACPYYPWQRLGGEVQNNQEDMTLEESDCHGKFPSKWKCFEDPNLHPCCPTLAENPYVQLGQLGLLSSSRAPSRSIQSVSLGATRRAPCRNKVGLPGH